MSENKRCYVHVQFKRDSIGGANADHYDSKTYVYLAEGTVEENEKYSYAVVVSPHSGLVVVKVNAVTALDESDYNGRCKYIVQFVDMTAHNQRIENEKRRAAIKKELERRMEERSETEKFERLFAGDEDAKALLEELKKLS